MKTKTLILAFVIGIFNAALAQENTAGVVKLRGTRLTYPLVKKWIYEFNKDFPGIKVLISPQSPADSIDLNLAAYSISEGDLTEPKAFVSVTRYTQLPVANNKRDGLKELQAKGFTEADFNTLYFSTEKPTFLSASSSPITLYTREKPACAAITFAKHFGNDPKTIQGIGVKGDDQDLASAVKGDVNGISFNNLGFIYDLNTRKVTDGLAIIPVDLNENGKVEQDEQIYDTLDELIAFIERNNHPKLVTEHVNVIFDKNKHNDAAGVFLLWVLTKGQQFNHGLGFLGLDENSLNKQRNVVASNFKTSVAACEGAAPVVNKKKEENK
jgi:phosphate transport system substrate-binding protein